MSRVSRFRIFVALVLFALTTPMAVQAQVFYAFPRATTQLKSEFAVGPLFAFGDDDLLRFGGFGRFYLVEYLDAGAEVIVDVIDGDFRGGAGFDVKYQLFPNNSRLPFDLAANAGLGFTSGASLTTFNVPFGGIASSPIELESGGTLMPYVGVYLIYLYSSFDRGSVPKLTDNDLDVEARIGLAYEINDRRQVFGTLHVGTGTAFYVGFNFDLK